MHTDGNNPHGVRGAFTLIELLVVIAIIAILAGLVLVGVMNVKSRAMASKAKMEVTAIAAAINDYTAAYGIPPVSKNVWDSSKAHVNRDFTYGNDNGNAATIASYGYANANSDYKVNNAEIIAVLRNIAVTNKTLTGSITKMKDLVAALNSKKVMYLDAPVANNSILPGVGPDGVFRDPWGNPYIITVDLDMDGLATDGFYTPLRKTAGITPNAIQASVAVWSMGPDGAVDTAASATPTSGANKDNVTSWEK